jgi:Subtilase family
MTAALALVAVGAPAPARAAARPNDGALSPRLAELAKPSVQSASPAKQAKALSLAADGPGSLLRDGNRVLVEVRFDHGAAAGAPDLRAAGAEVLDVSPRYKTVTVAAKPDELRELDEVPRIAGARPLLKPFTAASTCPSGAVVSEGVQQLRAGDEEDLQGKEARDEFGVDGEGVTVGVLSDSFDQATESLEGGPIASRQGDDVKSGDLPGAANTCGQTSPVEVIDDGETEGADEGRAMAQIVHDVAPAGELAFATAFTPSMLGFAENIKALAEPGGPEADVIADDVFFFEEPFFQDGPIANAVREVTEDDGVAYLSAAGNDNLFDSAGNEIASWEAAKFRDSGSCPPAVVVLSDEFEAEGGFGLEASHCLDFDPGAASDRTFGIKVAPGATLSIDTQWAEPWNGVGTDVDAFLLNSSGGLLATSLEDNVGGTQQPFEFVPWENESASTQTVQLVLNRYSGGLPRLKLALLENGHGVTGTEYPRSTGTDVVGPTVFGHSGSADAISVGAVPFDDSSAVEPYSSRGPSSHYFGPAEGVTPAAALAEPEVLAKPDVVATDCGKTTFFAFLDGPDWRFCGTSAAAPHAAGVAALMLDAEAATPGEVRAGLLAGATPIAGLGACAQGAGLVEAVGSIEALLGSASAEDPACSVPAPTGSVEEARAPGDWGVESPPVTPSGGSSPAPAAAPISTPGPVARASRTPPRTGFRRVPAHTIRTRRRSARAVFRFSSNQRGITFLCKVDRTRFHRCPARFARRYRLGRHVLRVKARSADGQIDRTPAVFRFRVRRLHRRGA